MVSAKEIENVVLDSGGSNEVTIYTESCEKIFSKILVKITAPQTKDNWSEGPKDTKIVDLLRLETRYAVRGTVDSSDESKIEALYTGGGVFNMTYKGSTFSINMEKLTITDNNRKENDETEVLFTALVGVDL